MPTDNKGKNMGVRNGSNIWGTVIRTVSFGLLGPVGGTLANVAAEKITEVGSGMASTKIGDMIISDAKLSAYELLIKTHRSVMNTVLWQNGLLLVSIFPVHLMHSATPFYIAYTVVLTYTAVTSAQKWPLIQEAIEHRSIHKVVRRTVRKEINNSLEKTNMFARAVVEHFGPDLEQLSDDIAFQLTPDIRAMLINMCLTLFMAFIAFRMTIIPLLEHGALQ